jgi:hypothetical protein
VQDRPPGQVGGTKLTGQITPDTPDGCNNGCCDKAWITSTFNECTGGGWDWQSMAFNYGWSWMNIDDAYQFASFLCSASGTSNFEVEGSDINNYPVLEAHFKEDWFTFGWPWEDQDYFIQGNDATDQHLHTMCGAELYDEF